MDGLRFVKGAVNDKSRDPTLTHVLLQGGRATSSNGLITLSAQVGLDIDAVPKAAPFLRALGTCKGDVTLYMTQGGKLAVRSGKFRSFIECLPNDSALPFGIPAGEVYTPGTPLIDGLRDTAPHMAKDAERKWAQGVLLRGQSIYATNNIVLCQRWLGGQVLPHDVCIPASAVNELVRIGLEPYAIQLEPTSATFWYEDGAWLHTRLFDLTWPDVDPILDRPVVTPFTDMPALLEALATVAPFTETTEAVTLGAGAVRSHDNEGDGAVHEVESLLEGMHGKYNHKYLTSVLQVAEQIDFTAAPAPAPWTGGMLRGAIIGMREVTTSA